MRTESNWDRMAGQSHSHTTVNDMKKVYPHPDDIELFPGGKLSHSNLFVTGSGLFQKPNLCFIIQVRYSTRMIVEYTRNATSIFYKCY